MEHELDLRLGGLHVSAYLMLASTPKDEETEAGKNQMSCSSSHG